MGNCLQSSQSSRKHHQKCHQQQRSKNKGSKTRGFANIAGDEAMVYSNSSNCSNPRHNEATCEQTDMSNALGDKGNHPIQQTSGSNAMNSYTNEENAINPCQGNQNDDPSWMKYLSHSKPNGDQNMDADISSAFGENWDPVLFDQRGSPTHRACYRYGNEEPMNQRNYYNQPRMSGGPRVRSNWEQWASDESINVPPPYKRPKFPVLTSAVLGFSPLRSDLPDNLEWYRNGELESPQPNTNNYLIKGKQRPGIRHSNESTEPNGDMEISPSVSPQRQESDCYREGWLRYTMFIHQDKTDIQGFYNQFRNAKHIFLSLEAKTGCELRVSKRVFIYRGRLVRTVVIDGPSRKHVIRCYTSLPKILTKLIILECERPSMLEPRPVIRPPDIPYNFPDIFQRPIAV